jgi:translation elongation factor EF-G
VASVAQSVDYEKTVAATAGAYLADCAVQAERNIKDASREWVVYPNPVVSVAVINMPQAAVGTVYIDITDRKGKTDHIAMEGGGNSKLQFDMSIYPPGQYIVSVCSVESGIGRLVVLKK